MNPFTDIVVPVRNALDVTHECMDMVFQHTSNFRLILVDDHSDKETTDYLMGFVRDHPTALYVRTGRQSWFTRASNIGLRLSRTPWVLLLNTDCQLNVGWLEELYNAKDDYARSMNVPEHQIALIGSIACDESLPRTVATTHQAMSYVTGHCWLMNRIAFDDMANRRGTPGWWFNELSPEQIHISSDRIGCWDLNDMGYITLGAYHAKVGHHGGRSWGHRLHEIPTKLEQVDWNSKG